MKYLEHIELSDKDIEKFSLKLKEEFETYLKPLGVKFPKENTAKFYWLICLRKYIKKQVHKDAISEVLENLGLNLGKDQQVRHLAADGWYVLNKGDKVPDKKETIKSGFHMLYSVENCKKNFYAKKLKRQGRIAAKTWDDLKIVYSSMCATCGSVENKPNRYFPDKVTMLEQGHIDPNKPLSIDNIIPQCQYCNKAYKDKFMFDENGRIVCIMNTEPVIKSPENVKKDLFEYLKDYFQN